MNDIDAIRERHAKAKEFFDAHRLWPAWLAIGGPEAEVLLAHIDTLTAERDEAKDDAEFLHGACREALNTPSRGKEILTKAISVAWRQEGRSREANLTAERDRYKEAAASQSQMCRLGLAVLDWRDSKPPSAEIVDQAIGDHFQRCNDVIELRDTITTLTAELSAANARADGEREAVVAWLRERAANLSDAMIQPPLTSQAISFAVQSVANSIERGEHIAAKEGGDG